MAKEDGQLKGISWDQALDRIATKLEKIKSDFGAQAVAVSVGSIGEENIAISAFALRWRALGKLDLLVVMDLSIIFADSRHIALTPNKPNLGLPSIIRVSGQPTE